MFRFAILGAGKIAVKFVEAARLAECEVVAVASRSMERARRHSPTHTKSRTHTAVMKRCWKTRT